MSYILYKPYTDEEKANFVCLHQGLQNHEDDVAFYFLENNEMLQDGEIIINPNYDAEQLEKAKTRKLEENCTKRDERLMTGVIYKSVIFDSDTDQKVNLMFKANSMDDTETIVWLGKYNTPLICTKADLLIIGNLIAELTSEIWGEDGLNVNYQNTINACQTVEEVNSIIIDYYNPSLNT